MRRTFAELIEEVVREEVRDELNFHDLQSPLTSSNTQSSNNTLNVLLDGEYATVFQRRSYLPTDSNLQNNYRQMTQYVSKLALLKELCEKAETDAQKETCKNLAKQLYNPATIQDAFKNIPVDEVLQTLNLLRRTHNNNSWLGNKTDGMPLRQIGREILNIACENPVFYQQEPGSFVYPKEIQPQLSKLFSFINDDKLFLTCNAQKRALTKKLIKGTQTTYNNIKDSNSYPSKQALLAAILTTWEKSKDYLTSDDIYWLKLNTGNLKDEYNTMPSLLQEIIGYCKRALHQVAQNPWTAAAFTGFVAVLFVPTYIGNRMYYNYRHHFIKHLQDLNKYPRPFTEEKSKAFDKGFNRLFAIAKVAHIDLNQLEQEANKAQENENRITQSGYLLLGTFVVMSITLLGQYKNSAAPMPLPDWVNELEKDFETTSSLSLRM